MLATTWLRSRTSSLDTVSPSAGTTARIASIATRAWARSPAASFCQPSDEIMVRVWTSTSETLSCPICSASSSGVGVRSSSATDTLRRPDLLGVDLLERPALLEAGDLPLGGVPLRARGGGGEGGERLRLAEVGLPVADPDLDGREAEVRPDAPPELRVLGHRACRV